MALACVVGYLTGALGSEYDEDIIESLQEYKKTLTPEQLKRFDLLYDFLNDDYTYPRVNRKMLKDDRDILIPFLQWIDDNDIIEYRWNWDFVGASEKVREL